MSRLGVDIVSPELQKAGAEFSCSKSVKSLACVVGLVTKIATFF